jgi:AAA domain
LPSLSSHHSSTFVKLLYLGDSKAGKTTSLWSLAAAGYKLRILDFDNLLDTLALKVRTNAPDRLDNIEFKSLRDAYKGTSAGTAIDGKPKAWLDSLRLLNQWKYDDTDLGVPGTWGPDCILVVDSLSRWCDSAYDFHESFIPAGSSGKSDGRAVYGNAQDDVERQLANLTSPSFATNVIVICHGQKYDTPDGRTKIFPQGVGQKLSPKIPQYFPNYIRLTRKPDGKRIIQVEGDSFIDLATTRPDAMPTELDASDGLAKFFAVLRPPPTQEVIPEKPKPTIISTLRRV